MKFEIYGEKASDEVVRLKFSVDDDGDAVLEAVDEDGHGLPHGHILYIEASTGELNLFRGRKVPGIATDEYGCIKVAD